MTAVFNMYTRRLVSPLEASSQSICRSGGAQWLPIALVEYPSTLDFMRCETHQFVRLNLIYLQSGQD
jgi:hypothetical protein